MKQIYTYLTICTLAAGLLQACSTSRGDTINMTAIEKAEMVSQTPAPALSSNIYDYSYTTIDGQKESLSKYKGKKMLIVNTASECGYTPQYEQLEEVYKKFGGKVVVIGFPSNDFGGQEPGENKEIKQFCQKNYGVTFPLSEKVTVKGENKHPIFKWLTSKELNRKEDSEVKWNFQKYLIDERGNLISIYYSKQKPDDENVLGDLENK